MQICLSQQSPSPSHHFLHSNAFSHLNKIPLPATRRGFAGFVDIHFCTFAMSSEETRNKRRFLRARLCTVYYRDSVETIKNGRAWRFFFFFTMHHPPAPFSTGGSPSARRLCRMDGKGKRFFSPVSVLQTSLRQINGSESLFHLPFLPHRRSSFPDFAALLDFLALKATIIPVLQG